MEKQDLDRRDVIRALHRRSVAVRKQQRLSFGVSASPDRRQNLSEAEDTGGLLDVRFRLTTITLCLGVALYAFNAFLVGTALPSAVDALGGARLLPWASTLYLAASIVTGAGAASLKARLGARPALIAASLLFGGGTLLAASAGTMGMIIAGRILQGGGEGAVAALCYMLIPQIYPQRLIAKVFAAEAAAWAVCAFAGPALAGLVTEIWSWRAAFLINMPVLALFLLLVLALPLRQEGARQATAIMTGLAMGRFTLLLFAFVLLLAANVTPLALSRAAMVGLSLLCLWLFIRIDAVSLDSIFPKSSRSREGGALRAGLWAVLLMPLAQAAFSIYGVYALQHLWGFKPLAAGAIGALSAVAWSVTAMTISSVTPAVKPRCLQLGVSLEVLGLGLGMLALIVQNLPLFAAALTVTGAGFGLSWAFLSEILMAITPQQERDKTSGLLPTLQSAGYALGGAVAGLVANGSGFTDHAAPAKLVHALGATFLVSFVIALGALAAMVLLVKIVSAETPEN
ncbi:MFS transporter [Rhizobium paknamense]|uniref:MFS family permease n=1 Tax=Rhizobium paknamense TaxID=1206817 RepID=A0ABU0ICW5_9HYPH|nr:MFS transporter [Rhizobium paknamense]MDQ0455079.1 MFS family permease [Rhizobium paknamense]